MKKKVKILIFCYCRGEIKDLFEKVTKDELQKSIVEGDAEKQELMKSLILALPYHSEDLAAIENLARQKSNYKTSNHRTGNSGRSQKTSEKLWVT